MSFCDTLIKASIGGTCTGNAMGVEREAVIINRDDIDFVSSTIASNNGNTISAITLKSGKIGYKVTQYGAQPFNGSNTSLSQSANFNTFERKVSIVVPAHGTHASHDIIDGLANGEFVVIVRNKAKEDNTSNGLVNIDAGWANKYEVYGWYQGLHATSIDNDKYNADTLGGYAVELTESNAPHSAMYFIGTTEAATDAAFASLYTPANSN